MRRSVWNPWSLLLAGILCFSATAAPQGENPVPLPALENLSPEDREQVRHQWEELNDAVVEGTVEGPALGRIYGETGALCLLYEFVEPAEIALERAVELSPETFRWHYYLGTLYQRQGRLEAAERELERAEELRGGDLATLIRLGNILLDQGELDRAESRFLRALEEDRDSAAAVHGLGRVAYSREEWKAAVERFERALALQPKASSIHHLLGMAYRNLDRMEEARAHLTRNRHGPVEFPDPLIDEMESRLRGARVRLKEANRAIVAGDLEFALSILEAAEASDPTDPLIQYNLGWVHLQRGQRDRAIEYLRRALALDPEYRNAHVNLGTALAEEGRLEEAARHLSRAVEIDPLDHQARLRFARLLLRKGDVDEAERQVASILETAGVPPALASGAHALRGELLAEEGDLRAIQELEAAVRLVPENSAFRMSLATLLAKAGRLEEAATHLEEAVSRDPDSSDARQALATVRLLSGQETRARQVLEEGIERRPDGSELVHMLARLLATARDPAARDASRALELAQVALEAHPTPVRAETLAMALAEAGRYRDAVRVQERILESLPDDPAVRSPVRRRLELYRSGRPVRAPWDLEGSGVDGARGSESR